MTDLKTICEAIVDASSGPITSEKVKRVFDLDLLETKTLVNLAKACLVMREALEFFQKDKWQPGYAFAEQELEKVEELFK